MIVGLGDTPIYGPPLSAASKSAQAKQKALKAKQDAAAAKRFANVKGSSSSTAPKPASFTNVTGRSSSTAPDANPYKFADDLPYTPPAPKKTFTNVKGSSSTAPLVKGAAPAAAAPGTIMGMSRSMILALGLGLVAAVFVLGKGGKGGPRRKRNGGWVAVNPRSVRHDSSRDPEVQAALEFRRAFHWGIPSHTISRRKISPSPRVLVNLGKVHSVTYQTKKRGERARLFEHEFEKSRPVLGMDIRNKRLHFVGGSYTVTDAGIEG